MSKITRPNVNVKAFASDANVNERTIIGSVESSDDLELNLNDTYARGWGFVGKSDLPTFQDFNAAMFTGSQLNAYLYQKGVAEWCDSQEYHLDSITNHEGRLYRSLKDNNVDLNPSESPDAWAAVIELSSAIDSDSETTAATSKAVKDVAEIAKKEGLGYGQTWQNLTADRRSNVEYVNNTGKPIQINIILSSTGTANNYMYIGGVRLQVTANQSGVAERVVNMVIPNNTTYKIENNFTAWNELR